jgi:hypothetical protein
VVNEKTSHFQLSSISRAEQRSGQTE